MKVKGLLTLKALSTEKIIDVLNYSLIIKKGLHVSYCNKRFVTLFLKILQERIIHLQWH